MLRHHSSLTFVGALFFDMVIYCSPNTNHVISSRTQKTSILRSNNRWGRGPEEREKERIENRENPEIWPFLIGDPGNNAISFFL